jgi:hypothetical protein
MVIAVIGAQWGDEGKGKIVDLLAERGVSAWVCGEVLEGPAGSGSSGVAELAGTYQSP